MFIVSILIAIVMFGLLIFVHELGHFLACKASGITVLQFTIGFGPALIKKQKGETLYALRLIPLGGAVMMKGADEEEEMLVGKHKMDDSESPHSYADDEEGSYYSVSKLKRFFVCLAGPMMNFLCGILILIFVMWDATGIYSTTMDKYMDGFAFESVEYFQPGDRIVSIDGIHAYTFSDINLALTLGEQNPKHVTYDFVIERNGQKIKLDNLNLSRAIPDEEGNMKFGFVPRVEPISGLEKVSYAGKTAMSYLQSAVKSLQMLVTGQAKADQMIGTVGIAGEISERVRTSSADTWLFVAFISVNLAFMNLLPIPALDGGKILFIIIEAIRRKRVSPKVEGYVSAISLVLILGLFVFVTYNDIARMIGG